MFSRELGQVMVNKWKQQGEKIVRKQEKGKEKLNKRFELFQIYPGIRPQHCTSETCSKRNSLRGGVSGGRKLFEWTRRHRTVLYCTALHCTALHCTAPHCTVLPHTAMYCTALDRTAQYCTISANYAAKRCWTALNYSVMVPQEHNSPWHCPVLEDMVDL